MKQLILLMTPSCARYLGQTKDIIKGAKVLTSDKMVKTSGEIDIILTKSKSNAAMTTNIEVVKLLLDQRIAKNAKLNDYIGSILKTPMGNEVLVLPKLDSIFKQPYNSWLIERYVTKLTTPEAWRQSSEFTWGEIADNETFELFYEAAKDAVAISTDTETIKDPVGIEMVGYCLLHEDLSTTSAVIYLDSFEKVEWMRKLNATSPFKIMQNGKYDLAYFSAYSAPVTNYAGDTKVAMHAWMSELPKDLGFLTPLLVRDSFNWKALGETGSKQQKMEYCARDCWGTLEAYLGWLVSAPKYAFKNYVMKQRLTPMTHYNEMKGLRVDVEKFNSNNAKLMAEKVKIDKTLATITGQPNFNANSYMQVRQAAAVLGHGSKCRKTGATLPPSESDERVIQDWILTHPLSEYFFTKILERRQVVKLAGTYLPVGDKSKLYKGRWLYSIDQCGTDTGRASSKGHHFWTGESIQTIPREDSTGRATLIKQTLVADPGFELFEIDKSQAEARGVAYCSGDEALLAAVNSPRDFHSINASAFFGIPYEEIRQDATDEFWCDTLGKVVEAKKAKTLMPELRDLSKRVNHGANYNMGARVLLDTMGAANVRKAQKLLKLNPNWTLIQVTTHLLAVYERTYPKVKTVYYRKIITDVVRTKLLEGATGWTRYCFGDPTRNKLDLNSYVAQVTQSLNAMDLDQGYVNIFNWWINTPDVWDKINIFAMIHDSVLGQNRIGHRDLVLKVKELLRNPITVTDASGRSRVMDVPTDVSYLGYRWGGNE